MRGKKSGFEVKQMGKVEDNCDLAPVAMVKGEMVHEKSTRDKSKIEPDPFNLDNDYLYGNAGNDLLTGGTGVDILDGGAGNDTYFFNRGDGYDVIRHNDTTVDKQDMVAFGAGIRPQDVVLARGANGPYKGLGLVIGQNGIRVANDENWRMTA